MKPSVQVNQKIETLVRSSGCECKLEDMNDQVVADDEWNEDRERMAQDLLAKDTSSIAPFWQSTFVRDISTESLIPV